jgi:hypothetical protein
LFAGILLLALAAVSAPAGYAWAQNAAPQAEVVTLEQYVGSLREAQHILSGSGEPAANLARARAALAGIGRVELLSGSTIVVSPLLGADGDELAPAAALARIDSLLAQLAASGGDNTVARLAVLESVLAGPAFQQHESWWDIFRRWLVGWLDRLLPDTTQGSPTSQAVDRIGDSVVWGVGILGTIAIVLLLAYWLRGLITGFVASAETEDGERNGDHLPQTPAEARLRAVALAGAGDYRTAVRHLYLSALLTLEQHGLVPADRSLTNREVLARVGSTHPLRPHLQPVVETFDGVWYGVREPDAGTYDAYTHAIDELEALAKHASKESNA